MFNVQIQLESGYLDVKEGTAFPLNFGVADIRDVSKRSGAFSKTIVLSGTKNNHNLLNHYYDVNIQTGDFNIDTLTKCSIIQNGIPILENAVLQLLSVNKKQDGANYEEFVEYEVLVKDDASDFFVKLDNSELTDLDFSDLDHVISSANIVSSWSHDVNDGYKYLLGYQNTSNYTLKEAKPAIYAKTYFDKIFASQGFSYTWDTLEVDRFDKLLIPFVGDVKRDIYNNYLVNANNTNTFATLFNIPESSDLINYTELLDEENIFNPTTGVYDAPFTLSTGDSYNFDVNINYRLNLLNSSGATAYLIDSTIVAGGGGGGTPVYTEMYVRPEIAILKNGVVYSVTYLDPILCPLTTANGTVQIDSKLKSVNIPVVNISAGDDLKVAIGVSVSVSPDFTMSSNAMVWRSSPTHPYGSSSSVSIQMVASAINIKILPSSTTIISGTNLNIKSFVPTKIKQKDFLKSIFQMYNLYIESDKDNPNILNLTTRDNFVDSGVEKDWTYKLAKDSDQVLQFLPELTGKKIQLTYKQDTDEANKKYFDTTREVFGQIEFTFDNEYIKGVDKKELIFSPTPLLQTPFNAYVPSFTFAEPKVNIRILYDGGLKACNTFNLYDYGTTGQTGLTSYPYAGHWDDPLKPSFDINFGLCDFYYYSNFQTTNNNLYNTYWRRTISQINTGKMLIAYFDLDELDIQSLKLNDKIRIDNSWWTINKIIDYSVNQKLLTKVELMSIDIDIDLAPFKTSVPKMTTQSENVSIFQGIANAVSNNINSIDSSAQAIVYGSGNVIGSGLKGMWIGDNLTPTEDGIIVPSMKSSNAEIGIAKLTNIPVFQNEREALDAGLVYGDVYVYENGLMHIVQAGR
jgi:hypothetical protein